MITPFEDLKKEAQEIQEFLDQKIDESLIYDNPGLVMERGFELSAYVSRTGKMKADAKYHLDGKLMIDLTAKVHHLIDHIGPAISAKVQNTIIDSVCKEEQFLLLWCDRLNRSATHQLEWCRSVLASLREESRAATYSNR